MPSVVWGTMDDGPSTVFKTFDQSLVEARAGDAVDLGRLLESFRPYLAAIARDVLPADLGGKIGASDVVQETVIRGLERFSQFDGSTREEFARWLRAILRNHVANVVEAYCAQKRDVSREQPDHSGIADSSRFSPSGAALSREERERLNVALAGLPAESRTVILLRHQDDHTFAEIGAAINKSEEAARKIWTRAVERLQHALDC